MTNANDSREAMTVAIIGLGSIGMRHARNLLDMGHAVIGFDPNPPRRQQLLDLGGDPVDSRDGALDGADAAVICSPNAAHLQDSRAALDAGCHVLIEKPLAHTERGIEEMLAAAAGKVVAVAHNMRFHPGIEAAREIIASGALGDLLWGRFICASYLPDWRDGQDYRKNYTADAKTGGVLFDIVHEFDSAHYLLGPGETLAASASQSGLLDMESEDTADVIVGHQGGARSTLHLDYVTRPARRRADVAGTKGLLEIDIIGRRLTLTGIDGTVVDDRTFDGDNTDTYRDEMADFLNAVQAGTSPRCDGTEALAVLRQVLAARRISGLPEA
ncbi:MAG: Gfo/Idh/MocA family protein [Alphaproteobacteria bacterium]